VLLFQTNGNLVLSLIATGIVAVVFAPLRNLVQRGVDRLMYGERDEPYRVLTRLGQQLETALEPTTALTVAVETIGQALKLPYVVIALRQAGALHTVAAYGAAQSPISRYPLTYAGEAVGELVVAPRAPNEALNPADQHLLWALARQIGVATKAASLAARLEQARLRLVTERGEARRQHPTLRIQLDAPERLPPLPAEIETAVYYIALEALTNVEKHARASMCIVRLAMVYTDVHPGEGVLELTIDDDGIGVSPRRLAA
jgi:nitrate/nitrite-specific signal transduction histidine kinase